MYTTLKELSLIRSPLWYILVILRLSALSSTSAFWDQRISAGYRHAYAHTRTGPNTKIWCPAGLHTACPPSKTINCIKALHATVTEPQPYYQHCQDPLSRLSTHQDGEQVIDLIRTYLPSYLSDVAKLPQSLRLSGRRREVHLDTNDAKAPRQLCCHRERSAYWRRELVCSPIESVSKICLDPSMRRLPMGDCLFTAAIHGQRSEGHRTCM